MYSSQLLSLNNFIWPSLFRVSAALFTFLMFLILGRSLSPENLGVFSFYFAFGGIVSVLIQWGMPIYLVKKLSNQHSGLEKKLLQFFTSIIVVLLFSILFIPLIVFSYYFFGLLVTSKLSFGLNIVFLSCVYAFWMAILNTASYALNGLEKNTSFIFFGYFFTPFIFCLLLLLQNNYELLSVIHYHIFIVCLSAVIPLLMVIQVLKSGMSKKIISNKVFRKSIKDGRHFLMVSIGAIGLNWIDTLIIGFFDSSLEVAHYTVASRIIMVFAIVLVSVNAITTPLFSKLYAAGEIKKLRSIVNIVSIVFMTSGLLTSFVVVFFGKNLLSMFGSGYILSYNILLVLLVGQFLNLVIGPVAPLLTMTGKEESLKKIIWEALILNIGLGIIFVILWGAIGVAISTSLALIYWNIKAMFVVKSHLGFWPLVILYKFD